MENAITFEIRRENVAVNSHAEASAMDRWVQVYEIEAEGLVRFASMLVGPTAAEDVVSDAMIRVLDRPLPTDSPVAYLYRTVSNTAKNHLRATGRRGRRERAVATRSRSVVQPDGLGALNPEIVEAISTLSAQQRAVIFLTYWSDLSPAQVANYLDVSTGTVKRQLARGRAKLGKALS